MKAQLQALQQEDAACVLIARRINKLGFSSSSHLRAHFSRYGQVKGVFVSHSRVRSLRAFSHQRAADAHWRLRAAALGFVVMESPEVVQMILDEGVDHTVIGVPIHLHPFQRHNPMEDEEGENEEYDNGLEGEMEVHGRQLQAEH